VEVKISIGTRNENGIEYGGFLRWGYLVKLRWFLSVCLGVWNLSLDAYL